MISPQIQNWMHDVHPHSAGFQTFEDVPLTPVPDQNKSPNASTGFSHEPLEHEIVASESVWDDMATSSEFIEQQITLSPVRSGSYSPAVRAAIVNECSLTVVVGQADVVVEVSRNSGLEEAIATSAGSEPRSELAELTRSGIASAETLVEAVPAPDTAFGPTYAVHKTYFPTFSPVDQSTSPSLSENDNSGKLSKSAEDGNQSKSPADLKNSVPSATFVAHATLPRVEKATTPVSIPEFFDIPIPVFPFPAGTSRCKNRNCPIKIPHEQGPYLHEGKLRTREGSIFGSSNPPPEIWFLYDRSGNRNLQGTDDKPFAPVELFVKYHFGQTLGECVVGLDGAGRYGHKGAKEGGKKSRCWRLWG